MKRVMVRYKTKPDRAEENVVLIERVFAALAVRSPEGLRYASFRLEDGVSFVHVAMIEGENGTNPLAALPEFRAFTEHIEERCDEPPRASVVDVVGAYGLFE